MSSGGARKGSGRKPSADKRGPLPFRLRASVIVKAKALGRDAVEEIIEQESRKREDEHWRDISLRTVLKPTNKHKHETEPETNERH